MSIVTHQQYHHQNVSIGFGTAALGHQCRQVVTMALREGFRKFDTAEADLWYDQDAVGGALQAYFDDKLVRIMAENEGDGRDVDNAAAGGVRGGGVGEGNVEGGGKFGKCEQTSELVEDDFDCRSMHDDDTDDTPDADASSATITINTIFDQCQSHGIEISTKIPPWELTSVFNIRRRASKSRKILVGFCDENIPTNGKRRGQAKLVEEKSLMKDKPRRHYPLDVYYIHAPTCWQGWHPRCNGVTPKDLLPLRKAWKAMEWVHHDGNAKRIGLSNVHPNDLLDIIRFVKERIEDAGNHNDNNDSPPPRMPDVVQAHADPIEPSILLRQICRDNNIEFVSYSTLGTQHAMRSGTNPVLGSNALTKLAERHRRSVAEIVVGWALRRGMSVIPRSSNRVHIRQLSSLLGGEEAWSFLTEGDLAVVDGLQR